MAAGALAIGGIVAGASLAGHASPAPAAAAGSSAQAAALNSALSSADTPGTLSLTSSSGGADLGAGAGAATVAHPCARAVKAARTTRRAGHPAAARAILRAAGARCLGWRHRLARAALLRGIDGQFTFRGKGATIRTLAFERGVVQSVSGSDLVVQASDGTTWTWVLGSTSVVRESGKKTSTSALAAGEPVWVGGPVVSGAKDARLVVIRPPSAPSSSSSPSPSASTSTGS